MFYCEGCAKKNDWPESIFKSRGPCEVCGKVCACNDIPSSALPKEIHYRRKKEQ